MTELHKSALLSSTKPTSTPTSAFKFLDTKNMVKSTLSDLPESAVGTSSLISVADSDNYSSPAYNTPALTSSFASSTTPKVYNPESGVKGLGSPSSTTTETPWYQDAKKMQGYAGLANSFVGLATLVPQLQAYKQNLKESKHNLERAKVAAGKKDTMYNNLSNHTTEGVA